MLLSAVSLLVVAQSSSEIAEGLKNNAVQRGIIITGVFSTRLSYLTKPVPMTYN